MEQLRLAGNDAEEKERIVLQLSQLADASVDARAAIGYHAQAIPLLVGLLRSGSTAGKTHAAATLAALCDEDELRVKVLLGGCIPPMLALLKAGPKPSQLVAAEALFAVSKGGSSRDSVGTKIFATEGVVPALLEQLQPQAGVDMDVVGLLTGALRNLCYHVERFWPTTVEAGGVELFGRLLSLGKPVAQENAAALLTSFLTSPLLLPHHHHQQQQQQQNGGAGGGHEGGLDYPARQAAENAARVAEAGAIGPLLSLLAPGYLEYAEAKRMLVGLITLSSYEAQPDLVRAHIALCSGAVDLWAALRGREGVLALVGLLGLSTEDQQEYACTLLFILTNEEDDSKWAITAAGGIPPLVQLLGTGTLKAREDAAAVLGNLCGFSEDIRACVETAEATPALLSLLGSGSQRGQAVAAKALTRLVSGSNASASTVGHLTGILVAEAPESKVHVLRVLGHLLAEAPDAAAEGSAANEALQTLIAVLDSEREESQESSAAVLANLFAAREDLRESRCAVDAIPPLVRLVDYGSSEHIAMQAARALAAIFCSIDTNDEAAQVARDGIFPLVKLAKSSATAVAEVATTALANLLANEELAQYAPAEEVILPLSRLLREGTAQGKEHAAGALAHLLHSRTVDDELADSIYQCSTVLALVGLLHELYERRPPPPLAAPALDDDDGAYTGGGGGVGRGLGEGNAAAAGEEATMAALEALAALARAKSTRGFARPPLQVLSEVDFGIDPLVLWLAWGSPAMQEKAIEVLTRLCKDRPEFLGSKIAGTPACIAALTERITGSPSLEVKVGGTALLICAAKEYRQSTMEALTRAGTFLKLIQCLVDMLASKPPDDYDGASSVGGGGGGGSGGGDPASASVLVNSVALWLLAVIASHDSASKVTVAEVGAVEVLTDKLAVFSPNARTMDAHIDDNGGSWVSALLLAILFRERDVTRAPGSARAIPPLTNLLRSEEPSDRFFAAQALASLVSSGSRGTLLAVANAGAIPSLIALLGTPWSEVLAGLADDFALAQHPERVALERLFRCDDIKDGAAAQKAIPLFVDLLKPLAERPGAPPQALGLLTQIARGSNLNKVAMAESGALEALTKYLSIGPQESIEEAVAELLRILFGSEDLRGHPTAMDSVEQLVAVLRLGSRGARLSAARALEGLFVVDSVRASETSAQAVQPLVEMLRAGGTAKEQHAGVTALTKLAVKNGPKITAIVEAADGSCMESLCRILGAPEEAAPAKLKEDAAELLRAMFALSKVRGSAGATAAIAPLVGLLGEDAYPAVQFQAAAALEQLLDDEAQCENVAAQGAVIPLAALLGQEGPLVLHATVASALFKLAQDRRLCKLDMAAAGVVERMLAILPGAPNALAGAFVELLRVLTNNSSIARGASAGHAVGPLFHVLRRQDLGPAGLNSALQTLANVLEKPSRLQTLDLEPLYERRPPPPLAAPALDDDDGAYTGGGGGVGRGLGEGNAAAAGEEATMAALEALAALARAKSTRGFARPPLQVLSEVDFGIDPLVLWLAWGSPAMQEKAIEVLTRLCKDRPEFLGSKIAGTPACIAALTERITGSPSLEVKVGGTALLICAAKEYRQSTMEALTRAGTFLKLIQCLVDMLASKPPDDYDGASSVGGGGGGGSGGGDPASASVLVNSVALWLLAVIASHDSASKVTVAEVGAVEVLTDKLAVFSPNARTMDAHIDDNGGSWVSALLLAILFRERDVTRAPGSARAIPPLTNLLRSEEPSDRFFAAQALASLVSSGSRGTLLAVANAGAIPSLIALLGTPWSEVLAGLADDFALAQHPERVALERLFRCDDIKDGAAAQKAIPLFVDLLKPLAERPGAPPQALGLLTQIARGSNLNKVAMAESGALEALTKYLSIGPQVIPQSTAPEWKQAFSWPLDVPPSGQKLNISCKSKTSLGKGNLGRVSIQIDSVITLGSVSGTYALQPENNRDGTQRTLDVEFVWSN
eukprot:jgi/Mesen1/7562/ME000392S06825